MAYVEVWGNFVVKGTAERPVEFFPSNRYHGYEVRNYRNGGTVDISYAKVLNPRIDANRIDHSYSVSQDMSSGVFGRYLMSKVKCIPIETSRW